MINFNNVSLLTYTRNNKYLGTDNHYFATEKNISVNGYLYDFQTYKGIGSGVLSGFNAINNLADQSLDDIIINGKNFGSGYVKNISVENGNWVRLANYNAEIVILETGDLYNMVGEFYPQPTGFPEFDWKEKYLNPIFQYVDNISIYTDINKSYQDSTYEIKDGCEISFNPAFVSSGEIYAKSIYNLFKRSYDDIVREVGGYNFNSGSYKVYESRTIDQINKKYVFDRSFVELVGNPSGSNFFEFKISQNENGIVNASEKSRLPKSSESSILSGFKNIFTGAETLLEIQNKNQISGLSYFLEIYGVSGAEMYEIGRLFSETDEYYEREVSYSNDGFGFVSTGYSFRISKSIDKEEDGTVSCTIDLSIDGDGSPGKISKWNNALSGYNSRKLQIESSALNGVLDNVGYINSNVGCGNPNPPFIDNYSLSISKYDGTIEYSVKATNKQIKETGSANGLAYVETETVRDEPPRTEYKKYVLFNGTNNGSQIQNPYPQTSLGEKTVSKKRKYINEEHFEKLELPEFGNLPEFTIKKTTKKSNGVAEIEYVYNYH